MDKGGLFEIEYLTLVSSFYGGSMNTASFFRNVADYNVLCRQTALYAGVVATYHIVSTINLEEETFQTFCSNFQKSYEML